ncbi:hypothetical protein HMI54_002115 [Coelomomyces lativittatus]|nr:hypothetical protein HMI54_002115 [Coelomomyces lativittatus]
MHLFFNPIFVLFCSLFMLQHVETLTPFKKNGNPEAVPEPIQSNGNFLKNSRIGNLFTGSKQEHKSKKKQRKNEELKDGNRFLRGFLGGNGATKGKNPARYVSPDEYEIHQHGENMEDDVHFYENVESIENYDRLYENVEDDEDDEPDNDSVQMVVDDFPVYENDDNVRFLCFLNFNLFLE